MKKELFDNVCNLIKIKYEETRDKYICQKQKQNYENMCIYNEQMHMRLQYALAMVLSRQKVSPLLSQINNQYDLIRSEFEIGSSDTIYSFVWNKTTAQQKIPSCVLVALINRINSIIVMQKKELISYASMLYGEVRTEYIMNNQLLYNGFHVVDIKDDIDSITIFVVMD